MAISIEGVRRFTVHVVNLQSFPLFCAYLLMVFLAPLWQRISKPLSIRPVSIQDNIQWIKSKAILEAFATDKMLWNDML